MADEKSDDSQYLSLSAFLSTEQSTDSKTVSLIRTEHRPHKTAYIEFVCGDSDDDTLHRFASVIDNALRSVQNGLYVLLQLSPAHQRSGSSQAIVHLLATLYQIMENAAHQTHGLLFDGRLVIVYSQAMHTALMDQHLRDVPKLTALSSDFTIISSDDVKPSQSCLHEYHEVVFGGTFDHLHSGHKVLITIAAYLCRDTLYIGLSVDQLLANKKCAHMLQSFEQRKQDLLGFIQCVKPGLHVVVEALSDMYGPSVYETIDALVVSKETEKGGRAVNSKRVELGRKACSLVVVECVASNRGHEKVSSTSIRQFAAVYNFLYTQWTRLVLQLMPLSMHKTAVAVAKLLADEWWHILCNFYRQKQRFYHTLRHVQHMVRNCIRYSHKLQNVTAVLLSIWFHDIVYDPTRHDNELLSADVFKFFMRHLQANVRRLTDVEMEENALQQRVVDYITATIKHEIGEVHAKENANDVRWFLDFDLAILGEEASVYREYAANIRQEYAHVESPQFEQKRAQVLRRFLDRKQLYFTEEFKQVFEPIARKNVADEIQTLTSNE